MDYGYKIGGGLYFPKKKLRGLWFSPPDVNVPDDGHGLDNGPLPRLVMGEILVDELTPKSQVLIITKHILYFKIIMTLYTLLVLNLINGLIGDNKEVSETSWW